MSDGLAEAHAEVATSHTRSLMPSSAETDGVSGLPLWGIDPARGDEQEVLESAQGDVDGWCKGIEVQTLGRL